MLAPRIPSTAAAEPEDAAAEERPLLVFANPHAGEGQAAPDRLEQVLAAHGLRAEIRPVTGDALDAALAELPQRPHLVVAAGGDGTIRTVAKALAGTPHTLGILPLGTINLSARTLGIPLELKDAVAVLADGEDRPVDLGEVNGERFVNNCSMGTYADLTRNRSERRAQHRGWSKLVRWIVDTLAGVVAVLRGWRTIRVHIEGEPRPRRVTTLLVSNNEYRRGLVGDRLDGHYLAVYVPRPIDRLGFVWMILQGIFRGPADVEELEVQRRAALTIESGRPRLLSIDGELVRMAPPFRFRSLPAALTARVPHAEAEP